MYLCAVCQSEKHKPLIWRLYCMRQNVWETLMQLFHLQFLLSYVIYSFIFLAVIFKHQADLKICLAWWRTCHKPWWEVAETQHYSSLSVGHSESRRMTDELGSRQRDLSTSSVTKRANGHWHAIIASSCRWSQREYKRQPVHRINHPFASEPSGGVSLLLFLTLRVRSFTSAGVTAQQRWSRSHGRTTVREDSHTGVCGGQLPCVLQH